MMFVHRRDLGGAPARTPVGDPAAAPWRGRAGRLALAALLMAGAAGCTSSPEYPIRAGERAGDGSIMADQPRYPISAQDAAQNAHDRAAQQGYPAYGAPPVAPPASGPYGAPPAAAPPASDDAADDAPHPVPNSSVESSDLPPPPAAPPAGDIPPPPPPPDAPQPHAISWGGGQIVFGADSVEAPALELAAYRHHRRKAAAASDDSATAKAPARHGRRRSAAEKTDEATPAAAADTPYQTVVRPGEKLADVAERIHSSREALTQLNDLKHPRRVKAGTVLKIPYRYAYQVQKGDTLYTISHRFSQDPDAMAKLNGLKHAAELQPGQTLTLPTDVSDTGKRDHAAASPIPVAAPETLAETAAKPAGRRHRKGAEVAAADAVVPAPDVAAVQPSPAHETRRERRRRERQEAAAARLASAHPAVRPPAPGAARASDALASPAAEVAADARPLRPSPEPTHASPQPLRASPEPVPTASAAPLKPSPEPVRPAPVPATVATAATAPRTPSFVPPSVTPAPIPRATSSAAAGAPTTPAPYYAGVRSSPSAATASTYSGGARVASLTPPRYAPSLPAGAYEPSLGRARPVAPSTPAGPVSSSEVAVAGRGRFIWPLRGQIVSAFGIKGEGQHNDGLDIAAVPGTGVRAAAAGEVVYAGSSIPGFGNLVLVKHAGGWVTAYAHLDRIEVRMRDTVAQGEEIGQSGQTGAVDRPLLHFEVRYAPDPTEKARPVDPALVLPTG